MLTWVPNPKFEADEISEFENIAANLALGKGTKGKGWSSGNRKDMDRDSRVFLLRQGDKFPGIVAAGYVTRPPYKGERWDDPDREALYVGVNWDGIVSPFPGGALPRERLLKTLAPGIVNAQSSGVFVPPKHLAALESQWKKHLGQSHELRSKPKKTSLVLPTKRNEGRVDWTEQELILTLELYFKNPKSKTSRKVVEDSGLSEELNQVLRFLGKAIPGKPRKSTGIYWKLRNFMRWDPVYIAQGRRKTNGCDLEEEVWNKFFNKPKALEKACESIRAKLKSFEQDEAEAVDTSQQDREVQDTIGGAGSDEAIAKALAKIEAKIVTAPPERKVRLAFAIARNKTLSELIKRKAGYKCQKCGLPGFEKKNGGLYAEAHHDCELSQNGLDIAGNLTCLCANCHRKAHYAKHLFCG